MCDYSLLGVPNRLAHENEDLVICRFRTGSLGLTHPRSVTNRPPGLGIFGRARAMMKSLASELAGIEPEPVAVCVPPGARLLLCDVPKYIREGFNIGPMEEVTFTQLTARAYAYRDAVRFRNGEEILLQHLEVGQRVRVLQLALNDEGEAIQPPAYSEPVLPTHAALDWIAPRSVHSFRRHSGNRHD